MSWQRPLLTAILSAALVAVSACARPGAPAPATPSEPPPTPTPVDPRTVLLESGRAMAQLQSFHFELDHRNGGTPLAQNLTLLRASGYVAKPDRISLEFTGWFRDFTVRSRLITVAQESFMTNPLTDAWESMPPEVSPLAFFDPQRGIASIMSEVREPVLVSTSRGVYAIRGTIASEKLASLFGETRTGETITVEVSIDSRSLYLLNATLEGSITPDEPPGVIRTIKLSQFNEPVAIEPPRT